MENVDAQLQSALDILHDLSSAPNVSTMVTQTIDLQHFRLMDLRKFLVAVGKRIPASEVDLAKEVRSQTRRKRGLFNFVGLIQSTLFGTATADDVAKLDEDYSLLALEDPEVLSLYKTAEFVAYDIVIHLIYPFTTPKVLLYDNRLEFKNQLVAQICQQYDIQQSFIAAYHPLANGLVERTIHKLLEILRPIASQMHYAREDWLPKVAASINGSINSSTGKSPYYIVYGIDKRLPYDVLTDKSCPVYNVNDFTTRQINVFTDIHGQVRKHLAASCAEMIYKQHKQAKPVLLEIGDAVMVREPERKSKLSPKFDGRFRIIAKEAYHKLKILKPNSQTSDVLHADRPKKVHSDSFPRNDNDVPDIDVLDTTVQTANMSNTPSLSDDY
ncbi:uncharacterized protein LOC121880335 [Homarus americanus]|uniref:uncharacterized protein LOC121880335 n=1 Tax=Homarus americanus TaxID=6706 RepID=UPI001C4642FD|nr:uncharacterized protein LOC121880335 [Homarus americanus]